MNALAIPHFNILTFPLDVARNARFTPPELGIVGFCNDLRGRGFKLWLDPALAVHHP